MTWCHQTTRHYMSQSWPRSMLPYGITCRIKTGHSNLVSCFGPRMRALPKVFYRGESRGKIPCQRPNPRAKTWHKIWMTGLNPNYDTIPIPSLQNSQNKCQKSSFTYDRRRHLILPLPPLHALPTLNAHAPVAKERRLMTSLYPIFYCTDNLNPQWMQAVNG